MKDWPHPAKFSAISLITLCLLLGNSSNAHAEIFRCTDDSGHVVFTQDPCGPSQQSEQVNLDKLDKNPKPSARVCAQVEKLANLIFPHIHETDSILDIYSDLGGRKYLSAGTTAVVNYVFNFRFNPKAKQTNVVALTHDKCLDGGFGRITEKDLPDWDRIKYAKKKPEKNKTIKQGQQSSQAQCKQYDEKIKALREQMANAKDKSQKLQARVDLEYYSNQKREHCEAKKKDNSPLSQH